MMFTDYYAENSCTAARSSLITGQTHLPTTPILDGAYTLPNVVRK